MNTVLALALAFWPLWVALLVGLVIYVVEKRRDASWDADSTLPGNLSEGRTR